MLYPPVADLLKNVGSRYLLVNVVAQRARQLAAEAEALQEELPEKPVTLAVREVAEGKLTAGLKQEYMRWFWRRGCHDCKNCRCGGYICH